MASILKQTIALQQKRGRSSYNISNWRSIKSPTARNTYLAENKTNITNYENVQNTNARIKQEAERLNNIDIEKYREEYNKLDSDIKPYFDNPDKVENTSEYKAYIEEKKNYEKQLTEYNKQIKIYNDYMQGYKLGSTGKYAGSMTGVMRQGYQDAQDKKEYYKNYTNYINEMKKIEEAPIIKNGAIVGSYKVKDIPAEEIRLNRSRVLSSDGNRLPFAGESGGMVYNYGNNVSNSKTNIPKEIATGLIQDALLPVGKGLIKLTPPAQIYQIIKDSNKNKKFDFSSLKTLDDDEKAGIGATIFGVGMATPFAPYLLAGGGIAGGYSLYKDPSFRNLGANLPMFIPLIVKGVSGTKNFYIKTIGTESPKESWLGDPFSKKGVGEILTKFKSTIKDGYIQGVHLTAEQFNKFEPLFKRLEDKGYFFAEKGGGNIKWLNIKGKGSKLTFNPFKELSQNPNIITSKFKYIKEIPQEIQNTAKEIYSKEGQTKAYNYVNEWYDKYAQPNTLYIPLRTVLGLTPETQAISPMKFNLVLDRTGNILQRLSGFKEYVDVKGIPVPIREFKQVFGEIPKNIKTFTLEEANRYYNNLYSNYQNYRYSSPYGISYNSLKNSYRGSSYKTSEIPSYTYTRAREVDYGYETPDKTGYNYPPYKENYPYYPTPPTTGGTPYTPVVQYKKYTEEKKKKREEKRSKKEDYTTEAYQTIYIDDDNKIEEGRYFPTRLEATAEGAEVTDNTPLKNFKVKRVIVERALLSRHQGTRNLRKFKSRGNVYIEKQRFRKDTKGENGKFNIMPFVFSK